MAYDNNNSGVLFRNTKKERPNQPEYTGNCTIDGVDYRISAWVKEGKPGSKIAGQKFFSFSFQRKDDEYTSSEPKDAPETPEADIPF